MYIFGAKFEELCLNICICNRWARGQLKINLMSIYKVFTRLAESRGDEGKLKNTENASEINH